MGRIFSRYYWLLSGRGSCDARGFWYCVLRVEWTVHAYTILVLVLLNASRKWCHILSCTEAPRVAVVDPFCTPPSLMTSILYSVCNCPGTDWRWNKPPGQKAWSGGGQDGKPTRVYCWPNKAWTMIVPAAEPVTINVMKNNLAAVGATDWTWNVNHLISLSRPIGAPQLRERPLQTKKSVLTRLQLGKCSIIRLLHYLMSRLLSSHLYLTQNHPLWMAIRSHWSKSSRTA